MFTLLSDPPRIPSPPWIATVLVCAVGAAVLLAYLSGGAVGIGADLGDREFSPASNPWQQYLLPVLDSPWTAGPLPSSLTARVVLAVALGRRSSLRELAATTSMVAGVLFAAWLVRAGVPLFPVLISTLALAFGPTFWSRGVTWTADALSPAMALLAGLSLSRWLDTPRALTATVTSLGAALAVAENPAWLATLPAAAVFLRTRVVNPVARNRALVALVIVSAFALVPVLVRVAAARDAPWRSLLGVDQPGLLALLMAGCSPETTPLHAWLTHARDTLTSFPSGLQREFTALGTALAAIGFGALWRAADHRRPLVALVMGVLAWSVTVPALGERSIVLPLVVCGWALVAAGLEWLRGTLARAPERAVVSVAAALLIVLPVETLVRRSQRHPVVPSSSARLAYDLRMNSVPDDAVFVADSRAADAAIVLSSHLAGRTVPVLPQDLVALELLVPSGRPVLALPGARSQLERHGGFFDRAYVGNVRVAALRGRQACTEITLGHWADVSLQTAGGAVSLVPASPGAAHGGVLVYLAAPTRSHLVATEPPSTRVEIRVVTPDSAATGGVTALHRAARTAGVDEWPITEVRIPAGVPPSTVTLTLAPPPVIAVATGERQPHATLCSAAVRTDLLLGRQTPARAAIRMDAAGSFGVGWHSPEVGDGTFRWTAATDASIRIRLVPTGPIRVTVSAMSAAPPSRQPRLDLAVNGCTLPTRPMSPGVADYAWAVMAECWQAGENQVWLRSGPLVSPESLGTGPDTRLLGALVNGIRFERIEE